MADVKDLLQKLDTRSKRVQQQAAIQIMRDLDKKTPYKTGALLRSRQVFNAFAPYQYTTTIVFPTDVANWTDQGTKRHIIRPRRAQALRFQVGGQTVFAKIVHHPGTKGTKWFSKTITPANWRNTLSKVLARQSR